MKWQILIPTVPARQALLGRLLNSLMPQVDAFSPQVQVVIHPDPYKNVGQKRQELMEYATADYITFIDDDDLVPNYYVDKILPLLDGVDYVGFKMQCYIDGVAQVPTFHNLRYLGWSNDDNGYYRQVSHLNPIKRSIALQGRFEGDFGEDSEWAQQVREIPQTQHYIGECMYYYFHSTTESLTSNEDLPRGEGVVTINYDSPNVLRIGDKNGYP